MKRRTKTKSTPNRASSVSDGILNPREFHAPAEANPASPPVLRKATKSRTRQRSAVVKMPAGAAAKLDAIHATGAKDTISDAEATRRAAVETPGAIPVDPGVIPVETETLPAVVNTDIAKQTHIEPEWHQVKHLPGYLRSPIRALGREVFHTFTNTPIEEIQVLANLDGQGPNSDREIAAAAAWLRKNGVKDREVAMDFQRSIPGYNVETVVCRARRYTFLLVRDFAGKYVYAWPSGDERAVAERGRKRICGAKGRLE